MKNCNDCAFMIPKERNQSEALEPHKCVYVKGKLRVYHHDSHPNLPTPYWCPLKDKK